MSRRASFFRPPMPRPFLQLVAALCLTSCAPHTTVTAPQPVRVLVYNIHAGKDAAGVDNLARVAAIIGKAGAEIVLLQEVDRRTARSDGVDQLAELARLTGLAGAFGRTLDYQGGEYGIATLSRWPIVSDSMIPLPVQPAQPRAGGSYEPRGALHVTVAHPAGPFEVLNTHLDASRDPRYRRQEIAGLLRALELAGSEGHPVLLGGDLNATPDDSAIASLAGAGLRDAWIACPTAGPEGTYPAAAPVKRIDYLWMSAHFACRDAAVLVTEASDHRPVAVTVALRASARRRR